MAQVTQVLPVNGIQTIMIKMETKCKKGTIGVGICGRGTG
jgi:hypothetical protein